MSKTPAMPASTHSPLERLAIAVEAIADGQAALAHAIARLEHGFAQLVAALSEDDAEPEGLRSLDGEEFGGERDANSPL